MLKGMEEFLFKQANVINFGEKKTLVDNLHLAILAKDSFNHKVFSSNLQVKKAENAKIQPAKTQKQLDSDRDCVSSFSDFDLN